MVNQTMMGYGAMSGREALTRREPEESMILCEVISPVHQLSCRLKCAPHLSHWNAGDYSYCKRVIRGGRGPVELYKCLNMTACDEIACR